MWAVKQQYAITVIVHMHSLTNSSFQLLSYGSIPAMSAHVHTDSSFSLVYSQ